MERRGQKIVTYNDKRQAYFFFPFDLLLAEVELFDMMLDARDRAAGVALPEAADLTLSRALFCGGTCC